MSNYPKVYGFCDAGCRRLVPSYEQFAGSAALARCVPDEKGTYILSPFETYSIRNTEATTNWGFTIGITVESSYFSVDLPSCDARTVKYKDVKFRYYPQVTYDEETNVTSCFVYYEVNGGSLKGQGTTREGRLELSDFFISVYVKNATDLFIYNEGGNVVARDGEDGTSVFIRYSANADGTDFTEEWSEGQYYVGFATAHEAPTSKSDYSWARFVSETLGDTEAALDGILEIQNSLIGGAS